MDKTTATATGELIMPNVDPVYPKPKRRAQRHEVIFLDPESEQYFNEWCRAFDTNTLDEFGRLPKQGA